MENYDDSSDNDEKYSEVNEPEFEFFQGIDFYLEDYVRKVLFNAYETIIYPSKPESWIDIVVDTWELVTEQKYSLDKYLNILFENRLFYAFEIYFSGDDSVNVEMNSIRFAAIKPNLLFVNVVLINNGDRATSKELENIATGIYSFRDLESKIVPLYPYCKLIDKNEYSKTRVQIFNHKSFEKRQSKAEKTGKLIIEMFEKDLVEDDLSVNMQRLELSGRKRKNSGAQNTNDLFYRKFQ